MKVHDAVVAGASEIAGEAGEGPEGGERSGPTDP